MTKKEYIRPDMQVFGLDVRTSLMAISDGTLDIDKKGDYTIDSEEGAFSRVNDVNLWDQKW